MFIRRRKLLVCVIALGVLWITITTFLGRDSHSDVGTKSEPSPPKIGSSNRQPEFYYDSADEVIELEAMKAWAKIKGSTLQDEAAVTIRQSVEDRRSQNKAQNYEQDLEEIKEDVDFGRKMVTPHHFKPVNEVQQADIEFASTRSVRRAGADWTPALEVMKQVANNSPGHNGSAVLIEQDQLSADERQQFVYGWSKYAHNEYVSRRISLHRVLPDVRDPECKLVKYQDNLLDVSVIITFHNEAWTTLLRTLHSVFDRSPSHLITEVILVDDCSNEENLKQQLDDYLELLPKVRLIRMTEQLGVVRARQQGAALAKGAVLVFLDSHVECSIGWLEPLLQRIMINRTIVAIPVMDIIDDTTFQYKSFDAKSINIGGFDWNLQFTWIGIPEREKERQQSVIDPIRSPTMSGGMYAISRKWFNHLGGYDIGMNMWGAENLEMSFRVWTCGGSLEVVPCSHVGHVFRKRSIYQPPSDGENPRKNFMRVAEVWMDDFKNHYYEKIGGRPSSDSVFGDLSDRKQLRTKLHCEPFQWFLKNVYPELFIPNDALAFGEIRNKVIVDIDHVRQPACLDSIVGPNAFNNPVKIWPCHGQGGNQYWLLSSAGEIRRDDGCFDYAGKNVVIYPCHGQRGNQEWQYTPNGLIRHRGTKRCMELSAEGNELQMMPCGSSERQIWIWKRNQPMESVESDYDTNNHKNKDSDRLKPIDQFAPKKIPPAVQEIAGVDY